MSYATVAQLRVYLDQVPDTVPNDAKLQAVLDRATAIIDTMLGVSFTLASGAGTNIVYGDGTDYLIPPAFVSVSGVTAPTGYTVPDYTAIDGKLIVTRDGLLGPLYGAQSLAGRLYGALGGWLSGVPYTVAGTFGYAAYPNDIVEACLEIAVDLWRFKDSGSIKVAGVEGAGVVSGKGLPATAQMILERRRLDLNFPGVW